MQIFWFTLARVFEDWKKMIFLAIVLVLVFVDDDTFSIKDDTNTEEEEDKADEDNYEEEGKATVKTPLTPWNQNLNIRTFPK